jgi:amino acid transporter
MRETSVLSEQKNASTSLTQTLGVTDLTWLYVVAIVNLNIVPALAAEGIHIAWVWGVALLCFFVPQGIAVMELAERMPGEGGLYLWTCETSGDFHGFICGWCYWLTNVFFVPSLLFSVAGVAAYFGASYLTDNRIFFFVLISVLLWGTILTNILGLGVGKWFNNIGGIGAVLISAVLIAFAFAVFGKGGKQDLLAGLSSGGIRDFPLPALGVACLALVGLELGPVMGDEVRNPRRTFPRAILLGGIICAVAYVGSTLSLALAVPKADLAVVQGVIQAIDKMAALLGAQWAVPAIGALMIASIVGSTSAWVNGSARILFVCGLDRYLPRFLGKVHPRYGSPWAALCMFGALASVIVVMSFVGASVKDAYLTLLSLSAAIQMIAYAYLFYSLVHVAFSSNFRRVRFSRGVLQIVSIVGLLMTVVAFGSAFLPSSGVSSVWSFILKMVLTLFVILGVAAGLFFYYSRQKAVDLGTETV